MSTRTVYAIEASGWEWSHVIAAASSVEGAERLRKELKVHCDAAPSVDFDSKSWEKQHARRTRHLENGPPGIDCDAFERANSIYVTAIVLLED